MKHLPLYLLMPLLCLVASCGNALPQDSVVHIKAQQWSLDHRYPWRINAVDTMYGSGVYLGRGLVLTNAHVVQNPQQIVISAADNLASMQGQLVHISEEADLALVQLDRDQAERWFTPIRLGAELKVGDAVQALGFPGTSTTQAITSGVVSRISSEPYVHSGRSLPSIQVDAAVNGGASGGALLKNNKLVGILFQSASQQQNVGLVIPLAVIRQFLTDVEDNKVDGSPHPGIKLQLVEGPMKRSFYKLAESEHAFEVIEASAFAKNFNLQEGDLILSLDGHKIGAGGWLQGKKNTSFDSAIAAKQIGDKVTLTVQREGEVSNRILQLRQRWSDHYLVPIPHNGVWPAWLSLAGVVLLELNDGYFDSVDESSNFLATLSGEYVNDSECPQSAVIIANILPHEANQGYDMWLEERIVEVNGARIQNFQHLNYLVRSTTSPWIEMVTAPSGGRMIFERAALVDIEKEINQAWQLPDTPFPAPPDSLSGICH